MERGELLETIARYCRDAGMAESTFGRRAVNDGKLVNRIRDGGKVGQKTLKRIERFIAANPPIDPVDRPVVANLEPERQGAARPTTDVTKFRFYDNRQKYMMFVNTCSEKWEIGRRIARELPNIRPTPPAVRIFDAGVGDGTVLAALMRAMHQRFPTMPFYVVAKEISMEDVRLTLDQMPDRLFEHPATVLVLTNLYYSESPWLTTRSSVAANKFVWKDVALGGTSSYEFQEQITDLQPFLAENWQVTTSRTGNPIYERPVVLVLYREDHRFLMDPIIPRPGATRADFDLVVAAQPYRARAGAAFKAEKVVAPLTRALGPSGRLIGIHSCGNDPGLELVRRVWPGEDPFQGDRHAILKATKSALATDARQFNFTAGADSKAVFRYQLHTLPIEIASPIGTSTLLAAWNAATYVAQIEEHRLEQALTTHDYVAATREVLAGHGGLWFNDESYVISRRSR